MKKILLLLSIVILLAGCGDALRENLSKDDTDLSDSERITQDVESIVKDIDAVSLRSVKVNENMAKDDGSHIVLIEVTFDRKNKADTTKTMMELGNKDILKGLKDVDGISEVTTFWESEYLAEGENIAKGNMVNKDGKLVMEDEWFDGRIFE